MNRIMGRMFKWQASRENLLYEIWSRERHKSASKLEGKTFQEIIRGWKFAGFRVGWVSWWFFGTDLPPGPCIYLGSEKVPIHMLPLQVLLWHLLLWCMVELREKIISLFIWFLAEKKEKVKNTRNALKDNFLRTVVLLFPTYSLCSRITSITERGAFHIPKTKNIGSLIYSRVEKGFVLTWHPALSQIKCIMPSNPLSKWVGGFKTYI